MQTVEQLAYVPVRDDTNNASMKEAIEHDVAQMESTGDDIAYPGRRHCSIRHADGSNDCEKETADDSKSEDVADTLERAISERMRVIRLVKGDTTVVLQSETKSHTKEPESLVFVKGVSMVSVAVCVVLLMCTSCFR